MKNIVIATTAGLAFSSVVAGLFLADHAERQRMEAELESWDAKEREWMEQLFEQRQSEFEEQVRRKDV
jgi:hypothetical protein